MKVISFPQDLEERRLWCKNTPNQLNPETVAEHMGICLKHWPPHFKSKIVRGGHSRPVDPPTVFGNTPSSFFIQSPPPCDRKIDKRRVTAESRFVDIPDPPPDNPDEIKSWDGLIDFLGTLPYPEMVTNDYVRLVCLSEDPMIIKFSITIDKLFKVKAFRQSTAVNIRHLIDGYNWKLTLYSQVSDIISYLADFPVNIQNDLKHIGEYFKTVLSNLADDIFTINCGVTASL